MPMLGDSTHASMNVACSGPKTLGFISLGVSGCRGEADDSVQCTRLPTVPAQA